MRRIIELALPYLTRSSSVAEVTLAAGELCDEKWGRNLRASLAPVPLEIVGVPAFRYATEQALSPREMRRRIRRVLEALIPQPEGTVVWIHNPGLARNLILTDELRRFAARTSAKVIFHHHDFWFENRWSRWEEVREGGFRTPAAVAKAIFAAGAPVVHATINRSDASIFRKRRNVGDAWMPNLASREAACTEAERREAAGWLARQLGEEAPVWIFPTRFLRRKNLGEAALLTRWLRPEAWMVTTAGVSSAEEAEYARRLEAAARRGRWKTRFRLVERARGTTPSITALLRASEAVMMTSAQEGFGLPYLEAVAAGRPLIARRLANVVPDLESFGFRLPWLYDEVWIDPGLIDRRKERSRQEAAWKRWLRDVPVGLRKLAGQPAVLRLDELAPLPFSRLTLDGQLEVLALPPGRSWEACARWNPELSRWKSRIAAGVFRKAAWPREADAMIGGEAYARRFWNAVRSRRAAPVDSACQTTQLDFIRERLGTPYLYPILFPDQ